MRVCICGITFFLSMLNKVFVGLFNHLKYLKILENLFHLSLALFFKEVLVCVCVCVCGHVGRQT